MSGYSPFRFGYSNRSMQKLMSFVGSLARAAAHLSLSNDAQRSGNSLLIHDEQNDFCSSSPHEHTTILPFTCTMPGEQLPRLPSAASVVSGVSPGPVLICQWLTPTSRQS